MAVFLLCLSRSKGTWRARMAARPVIWHQLLNWPHFHSWWTVWRKVIQLMSIKHARIFYLVVNFIRQVAIFFSCADWETWVFLRWSHWSKVKRWSVVALGFGLKLYDPRDSRETNHELCRLLAHSVEVRRGYYKQGEILCSNKGQNWRAYFTLAEHS